MAFSLVTGYLLLSSASPIHALDLTLKAKPLTQTDWQNNLESAAALKAGDKFQIQLTIKNSTTTPETQIQVSSKLPGTISLNELALFRIVEIQPGEEYVRVFTATIKNKLPVGTQTIKNDLSFSLSSQAGHTANTGLYFYTVSNSATNSATKSATAKLPATGPADVALGTILASAVAFAAFKLRAFARGY